MIGSLWKKVANEIKHFWLLALQKLLDKKNAFRPSDISHRKLFNLADTGIGDCELKTSVNKTLHAVNTCNLKRDGTETELVFGGGGERIDNYKEACCGSCIRCNSMIA